MSIRKNNTIGIIFNNITRNLILLCVMAFSSLLVKAYQIPHYKALIEVADSLQNCGNFIEAIQKFKSAELECLQENQFYSQDMHYILGSLATCAQQTDDYELFLTSLSKIDKVSSKIGYDAELTESFLCFEIAKGLLWRDASDEDLDNSIEYIKRGQLNDKDPNSEAYWEWLLHKYNYLSAFIKQNLDEAAPLLEKEYDYFKSKCKLSHEEIANELYESGLMWSRNLMNRTLDKECLAVLEDVQTTMVSIIPDFYDLDLEAGRIEALANLGENEKCIELGERILATTLEDQSTFSLLQAVKYNVGRSYNGMERYSEALNILQSTYTSKYAYLLKDTDTSFVKREIAYALLGLGKYQESEVLCKEILKGRPERSTLTGVYWILAAIANNDNNTFELSFIEDCVSALNQMQFEDLSYAETLALFANRYANFGQYESALSLINKAIGMFEKRGATNEISYYNALCLKGTLCCRFEDYDGCAENMQILISHLDNIKRFLEQNKDYELITDFLYQLIFYEYEIFSFANYRFLEDLNDEKLVDNQMSEYSQALAACKDQIFQQLDGIVDKDITAWLIEHNPDRLGAFYHVRALVYRDMNQYQQCFEYLKTVLLTFPRNCKMYNILAELRDYQYLNMYGPSTQIPFIEGKFESDKSSLKKLLSSFSANRRNEMWHQFYGNINKYVEYAHDANDNSELNKIAYNAILLSKGLLLQSEVDFTSRILRTNDDILITKYKNWIALSESNQNEADILEREIIRSLNSDYESDLFNTTWEDVKDSLKQNEYAIEFRAFNSYGTKHYLAFILGKSYSSPKMVEICSSIELQRIGENDNFDYCALGHLVWSKLNSLIPPSATVYFSPDMQLHSLPLENLPDFENPTNVISDRWNLYRVSSTRQLTKKTQYSSEKYFNLFGGMDYNLDANYLISDFNKNIVNYRSLSDSNNETRGSISTVQELPGSKREVSQLKEILSSKKFEYKDYTENRGTESCFKAYAGKNGNVLHLSTHGFYIAPSSNSNGQISKILGLSSEYNSNENALLRSGLMMAGVNETILGKINPTQCEDGILTAKEISELNLTNTDIAILSACETGVGVISGEGVFGLQRGFKLAGVKTIMMSLWKVDDNATERLMVEFYRNWLECNNAQKALLAAQNTVRNSPGWEDPKFWASFILLDSLN